MVMTLDVRKTLDDIHMAACYGTEEAPEDARDALLTIGEIARKALAEIDSTQPKSESRTESDAQPSAEPTHLTAERLRDALVASRIISPEAVEDPDGYDDGVTLFRIEGLHRRLAGAQPEAKGGGR
jgi:hypothetical protein